MLHVPWSKRGWGQEIPWERGWSRAWWLWRHEMQHEKLLFYISLSFFFWVWSRFCFVFPVWGFVFPFRDLSFCFGFWVFDFACMHFFLGFCTSFSGFWMFVLYYGHQGKLSVFFKLYDSILYFVILVLVLPFWNLSFCFGFWGFGFACMLFF